MAITYLEEDTDAELRPEASSSVGGAGWFSTAAELASGVEVRGAWRS